jgi:parallel beta-helix repeat protein
VRKYPILIVLLAILIAQPLVTGSIGNLAAGTKAPVNEGVFSPAVGFRLDPGDLADHVPITIDEDADFVSQGWPGTGTSGDPYIISGLNITFAIGMILISITDTTAYFVIRDCFLSQGSTTWAIDFHNATNGVIEHCTVNSDDKGMYIYQSNSTTISETEVTNLGGGGTDYGLFVQYSWDCIVANCVFETPNYMTSWWYESHNPTMNYVQWIGNSADDVLTINWCNNTVINHCTVTTGNYGLKMDQSIDVTITDLTITDTVYGMQFITCGSVDIADSYSESPETTLYMNTCNDSSVINSEFICDDAGDYAIGIYDSHRFTFTGNYLADARAYGIVVNNCEESVINSNTVFECEPVGIHIADCPDTEVIGNTVDYSDSYGIESHDSPRCTINNNDVYWAETGIYGNNPDNSTFIGNIVDYTLGGIVLENTPEYVNISDNMVSDSEYGIYVDGGSWCRIHDNTISDVGEGVHLINGANFDVYNNIITSASDDGINFQSVNDMYIHHNTITDADGGIYESSGCDRIRVEDNTLDIIEQGITIRGINSSIVNNVLTNVGVYGIRLSSVINCEISGNSISGAPVFGILSYQDNNVSFVDNVFTGCGIQFEISGPMSYFNHTFSGNTVNGQPIYYGVSEVGGSVSLATYAQVILLNCSYMDIIGASVDQVSNPVQLFHCLNITTSDIISVPNVRTITAFYSDNLTISDITSLGRDSEWEFTTAGVYLQYCDDFSIESMDYRDGYYGIYFSSSNYGSIGSYTADNSYRGISGSSSNSIVIDDCEITNMAYQGIYASGNNWNITNCYIYNVTFGIYSAAGVDHFIADNVLANNLRGISVSGASTDNGIVHHNEITDNADYGIYITSGDGWEITNNTILWNGLYGIYLTGSSGTEVYYNIIGISGTANGYDSIVQNWDDGVDTGNWWSDYDGVSPTYNTAGNGVDNYPMMFLPTTPIINNPMDLYYAEGVTGNELTWLVFDDYLSHYSVSIDGSVWFATACPGVTFSEIIVEVDGLAYGDHAVVITVWDIEDNTVTNSLTIHVFDDTNPTINGPPNMEIFVGGSGQEMIWEVFDLHPDTYTVELDGEEYATGSWTSGELSINIDGLTEGEYVLVLYIYDVDGNEAYDGVEVLVIDDSVAPAVDSPEDLVVIAGTTGNSIIWTPTDEYPASYVVSSNGSTYVSGDWGGSRIIVVVDGLSLGNHTFTLTVWDGSGSSATDTVTVTVIPFEGWTPEPAPLDYTLVLVVVGAVAGVIVILAVVYFLKFKKS